jgi:hypothetical protein
MIGALALGWRRRLAPLWAWTQRTESVASADIHVRHLVAKLAGPLALIFLARSLSLRHALARYGIGRTGRDP